MNLGDVITCPSCGASSRPLHATGGRYPAQGPIALLATWTHGPYPRHDTASVYDWRGRCLWCDDQARGFAPAKVGEGSHPVVSSDPALRVAPADGSGIPLERSPVPLRGQLSLL